MLNIQRCNQQSVDYVHEIYHPIVPSMTFFSSRTVENTTIVDFNTHHECIPFQFHSQFYSVHVSYKYGAKNILRRTYSKTISAVFLLGLKPPRFFFCARITMNFPVASLRGGKLF